MSVLCINKVSVTTSDNADVVRNASFSVQSGELHIIMGKNGSGKSSLLRAVMGHPKYHISKGSIMLGPKNITKFSPEKKAAAGLFLSMQYLPSIDGITLAYFLHQVHKKAVKEPLPVMAFYTKAVEAARELGIGEELLKRPLNAGLSGGERKQSEMLQLYLTRPRFAFLDEIDSGLDVSAQEKVFGGIEKLRKEGTAFVLVTHYPEILKRVTPDRVHIMKDGTIERTGGAQLVRDIARHGF